MIVSYRANLLETFSYDEAKLNFTQLLEDESDPFSGEILKKKNLYLTGIFVQSSVENHNGRTYPISEIKRAVDTINEKIRTDGPVCAELDHPEELTINLDRVGSIILKMWMDGPNGMGKMKILDTPKGRIIRTLIESGVKLGVSSRGVGNVDDRGEVSQFEIITCDVVCSPSAKDARPKPVYEASRNNSILMLAEAVSHDPKAQKHLTKELLAWINNLK